MSYADILNIKESIANDDSAFGERVLMVLEQQRRSKTWLAEQIGISKQALNYLLNRSATPKYVNEIAEALKVRPEWLLFGHGSNRSLLDNEEIKRIPILSLDDINAFIKNKLQKHINEFTHVTATLKSPCFAIILESSSMEPIFSPGTLLVFNSTDKVKNGDYVAFSLTNDNAVYFRQYFIDGNEIYLKAANNVYKNFKKNEIIILGVLIESRNHFK